MSYYQITAPLSDDERTTIVSAGFRSLDEGKARALGQGIENAGAKFKYAIIARNQLDDMETARRMRRAAKAFAEAIEALGLPSGSNTSAAPPGLLDDFTRSFRPHLFGIASAQAGTDGATGRAQASEQLDHCVQSVELLHAWTEQAARRLEFAITRPKRQPEQRVGLSRATMGRRARGAETRADNALEHFLRDIWESTFRRYRVAFRKHP